MGRKNIGSKVRNDAPEDTKNRSDWLSQNKELIALAGLFIALLGGVITFFSNQISSVSERHHDEINLLQSELSAAKAALSRAEDLQQNILHDCLSVVDSKDASRKEKLYAVYLQRELKRRAAEKGRP